MLYYPLEESSMDGSVELRLLVCWSCPWAQKGPLQHSQPSPSKPPSLGLYFHLGPWLNFVAHRLQYLSITIVSKLLLEEMNANIYIGRTSLLYIYMFMCTIYMSPIYMLIGNLNSTLPSSVWVNYHILYCGLKIYPNIVSAE